MAPGRVSGKRLSRTRWPERSRTAALSSSSSKRTSSCGPEFDVVMDEFRSRPRVALATLLAASRQYLDESARRWRRFYVLDALFPYWFSLDAWGYPDAEVRGFHADLAALGGSVVLVEIYVEGDLAASLNRAALREGPDWIDSQIARITSFRNADHPPRNVADVVAYYRATADRRRQLRDLVPWPIKIIDADLGPQIVLEQALAFIAEQQAEAVES
jgi:hypothetical protein